MEHVTLKLCDLTMTTIPCPAGLRLRAARLIAHAEQAEMLDAVCQYLELSRVIRIRNRYFAYDHITLLTALKASHPDLSLQFVAIVVSGRDARALMMQRIANALQFDALCSLDAIAAPAFSKCIKQEHAELQSMMSPGDYVRILRCHRSAPDYHAKKFQAGIATELPVTPVDFDDTLRDIPPIPSSTGAV